MRLNTQVARLVKTPEVMILGETEVTKLFVAIKSDKAGREDELYNINCYGQLGEFLMTHATTGARVLLEDWKLSQNKKEGKTYNNFVVYKATLLDFDRVTV